MLYTKIAVLCASLATAVAEWEDVILQPPSDKTGPVAALFFGQGADIKTSQYTKIMTSLQDAVDFPLWVGIPQFPMDVAAVPKGLEWGVKRINAKMVAAGMSSELEFYGGHSLGGAMMPGYVAEHVAETADGQFLLGAFLTRKYKTGVTAEGRPQVEYPVPTLTVGGELDGLCRITRITEALYTQVTFSADPEKAAERMPVTVIPGMNHMEFASGEIPSFVKQSDIQADIAEEEAQALVVADVSAFLNALVYPDQAQYMEIVRGRVKESTDFTQPITDALLMEGYEQFLPPCYCETPDEYGGMQYGTCESTPSCNGGVKWTTEYSQRIMAGLNEDAVKGLDVVGADSIHFVTEEDPSCHLPHIHGNPVDNANPGTGDVPPICESPSGCALNITTVTQHVYHNSGEMDIWRLHFSIDNGDTGYLPITARQMNTKLKSREAIWQAAGVQNVNFTETDVSILEGGSGDRCGEINQASLDWALSVLPQATKDRFEQYGQKMIIGNDLSTCIAGPCWIWDPLRLEQDDEANIVNVKSVWFGTENVNNYPCGESKKIPCSSGFHYCKILSPAHAVEWMYVDGLRNKLGTKNL